MRLKEERGVVLPLFAMSAVCFLLILFLIMDIGEARIAQGELYKSLDAGALAGALQSTHHEIFNFEQITERRPIYRQKEVFNYECVDLPDGREDCTRVAPYYEDEFIGYEYITHESENELVDEWVQIEQDEAFQAAKQTFWVNANANGLNENGREVISVEPNLKEIDVLEMKGEVKSKHHYLPSFLQGFYGQSAPAEVTFNKAVNAQAVVAE